MIEAGPVSTWSCSRCAVEEQLVPADRDDVAGVHERRLLHLAAVEEGAVAAAQVDEVEGVADAADLGVVAGDLQVGQHDVVVGVAADADACRRCPG